MDFVNDLNDVIRDLSEDQYLATSESPASAEEKINHYECLLHSWRRMLYSQIGVLKILHVLESQEGFASLVDEQLLEADAQKTLYFLTQEPESESQPIERQTLLIESENLGEQIQQKWLEVESKRQKILNTAQDLLHKYSRCSILQQSHDENEAPANEMKIRRDRILKAVEVAQAALIDVHRKEITDRMQALDVQMPILRALNRELKEHEARAEELERILYEEFGILARDDKSGVESTEPSKIASYDTWLQEEMDFVASVLQSETNALSLIFGSEIIRDGDTWQLEIKPKRPWPSQLTMGLPGAVFKGLTVKFQGDSMSPIDIKLKADLSGIPSDHVSRAQTELACIVDKWRKESYDSPYMNLHEILQVFIQHTWSSFK
eukprot:Gregarina_sp_Poly_1__3207@NODE_1912_length_3099_cov_79_291227_g1234_i0_p2_GENE_NODE_1912_length_3099_cov_79_291227_g1234_i0NODE_1912_length_3099_cov_79_291227_g1234_i0_p2_ORF_typecomplete_len379_score63_98Ins_P5_2kin/PF06090_12/0_045_NODE_1912_length_3099_cov_79_291227_g1234_i06181754